jgi:hypothetical protein
MKQIQRLLLIVMLVVGFGIPVQAQELTDSPVITPLAEATEIAVVPETTAAAPDTAITVEDGGTVNIDTPDSNTLTWLIDLVKIGIVAIVGGGSFALVWDRIRRSKQAKDTIEKLAEGLSPVWKSTLDRSLDFAEQATKTAAEMVQFAREVTDGRANIEGIPVTPSAPLTPQQMLTALIGTPEFEIFLARHSEQVESRVLARMANSSNTAEINTTARDAPPVGISQG